MASASRGGNASGRVRNSAVNVDLTIGQSRRLRVLPCCSLTVQFYQEINVTERGLFDPVS